MNTSAERRINVLCHGAGNAVIDLQKRRTDDVLSHVNTFAREKHFEKFTVVYRRVKAQSGFFRIKETEITPKKSTSIFLLIRNDLIRNEIRL